MTTEPIRLHKFIAHQGIASRRAAENMIASGQVKINGQVVKKMGVIIDPTKDKIEVAGKMIVGKPDVIVMALNKPVGVVSTTKVSREKGRAATDLVKIPNRLFIAGRLDRTSEGLMILTSDGDLAYQLTHPKYEHEKEYIVNVQEFLKPTHTKRLVKGLKVGSDFMTAKRAWITKPTEMHIILTMGKKHQIKRMADKINLTITRLRRVRIGEYKLKNLLPGKYIVLNKKEVAELQSRSKTGK